MLRMLARFTVVACALWASQALALGLGDINVKSRLNQPFSASIAVLGATPAQLDSLSVKLASAEEFNRAGIERSDYLSSLKFEVQDVPGGARVLISSSQLAREPFLNFILEVRSPDGKLLREYTVLLDPPVAADSSAPAAAPSSSPGPSPAYTLPPAPVVQVPAPAAPSMAPAEAAQLAAQAPGAKAPAARYKGRPARPPSGPAAAAAAPAPAPEAAAPAIASASGSSYGPTAPQETLWSIATKLRPGPQVSMDQVLLALYRANPQSFDRGSFNGLLKGQTLKVPSLADMQESSPEQAKQAVDAWRHGHHPGGAQKAETKAAAAPQPKPVAPKPAPPKPAKPIKLPAEVKPELPPPAPAPLPAPAAVTPAPEHKPAASAAPPPATPPAKPAAKPAAEAAPPAPAAPIPAPTAPASPAAPASTGQAAPATPAPASNGPAADTAANATATPPAAPEPPKKKLVTPPAPPPQTSLLDDQLPMIGGAVFAVVVGLFAWLIFRRRKAPPMPDFRAKAPAPKTPAIKAAPPPVPPPVKGGPPPLPVKEAELGDTTALPEEPPAPVKPEPAADLGKAPLVVEPLLAKTSLDDTAQLKAAEASLAEPAFSRTGQMKAAGSGGGDVDFDLTSQFEAQTLSVNLDANDPLSEADFHLAYGLYDEAASLLKQALAKEPQRQDLRQKLAETYFAGTKPMEFQETAEALHGQISPAEWQKIAIMGRQLCPDAALFKSDGSAPAPDIDLSLGDSIGPAAVQVLGAAPDHAAPGNVIDFDLDAELNKATPTAAAPVVAAPAAPAVPPQAAAEKADFDLSHFDFGAEPHPAGQEGSVEFNLDELDLSKPAAGGVSSGDEIGTKLDLARVYADMGDNDAARGLLNEVLNTGNAGQKAEAEALIKRLSA